jgi:dihydroorotate dehydrogenase
MLDAGATLVQICSEFIYGGADSLRNIRTGLNERLRKAELTASTTSESETEEKKEEKND